MNMSRYNCQIALPGFGVSAQQLLRDAKVLIVGVGGLGCPAAQYLAAAGVGTLGLADDDSISLSNLHRQFLYTPAEVGQQKAHVAAQKLQAQNPEITIVPHVLRVTSKNVMALFEDYDLIIDGTDNFESRYLLNDAAVRSGKPLIYGAIYQFEGQVSVWNILNEDGSRSPNYRDLFPEVDHTQIPNCAEGGVVPPLAGMIGTMQANEAIKYITKTGELLAGKLLLLDTQSMQTRIIKIGHATQTNITHLPASNEPITISAAELRQKIDSMEIELIDIRSSEEHDDFNIGGRHIPAYKIENSLHTLSADKTIVLYCSIGKRSADAAQKLRKLKPGLNVVSLEGGVNAWLKEIKA